MLSSNPIAGDHRDEICSGVALHCTAPVVTGIESGVLEIHTSERMRGVSLQSHLVLWKSHLWFGANRGWVQQDVGSLQCHSSRALWKPLIPADTNSNRQT